MIKLKDLVSLPIIFIWSITRLLEALLASLLIVIGGEKTIELVRKRYE